MREEDLLEEPDRATRVLSLKEEWETPSQSQNEATKEDGEANSAEKSKQLTAKQKEKLAKKAKYKNMTKSKSAGQPKPTGFEDFYCESPMTPEEYNKERSFYNDDRPAIFRIQEALSRYQRKRKLLTERWQIFAQYLRYGGVDVGAKMFGGVSEQELKAMDKEGIIVARSQTDISIDKMNLDVDFELVTKSFLSFYFPDYYPPGGLGMIKLATDTIRNWLNYLLYHEVVPEYADNIKAAQKYCNLAEKQLLDNQRLLSKAPGDFNKACSFLFGGYYYSPNRQTEHDQPEKQQLEASSSWGGEKFDKTPMTPEVASKVIMFAIACSGSDEQATRFIELSNAGNLSAQPIRDIEGFEVVDIVLPNSGVHKFYSAEGGTDLNPIGKVRGKAWRNPSEPAIDLAPGETLPDIEQFPEFEFFVEESLLQHFYQGMKIVTTVWELGCGVFYYDEIMNAYCEFYTTLLNDLMLEWKDPRALTKEEKGENETEGKEGEAIEGSA